jgi:hypothetical protein
MADEGGTGPEPPTTDRGLWEAACSVRPFLEYLLPDAAASIDAQISDLLERGMHGDDVAQPLHTLLDQHEETSAFVQLVLDNPDFRPPLSHLSALRGTAFGATPSYSPLGGIEQPLAAAKYRCPRNDYVWYRLGVGVPIPHCPTHGCILVRVPNAPGT